MTPDDLMRIAEAQRKCADDIRGKLEYIKTIIERLSVLEQWENRPNKSGFIKYLTFNHHADNRIDYDMRDYVTSNVAEKMIPIFKEELLLDLQRRNEEVQKLKERLTGVKEEAQ